MTDTQRWRQSSRLTRSRRGHPHCITSLCTSAPSRNCCVFHSLSRARHELDAREAHGAFHRLSLFAFAHRRLQSNPSDRSLRVDVPTAMGSRHGSTPPTPTPSARRPHTPVIPQPHGRHSPTSPVADTPHTPIDRHGPTTPAARIDGGSRRKSVTTLTGVARLVRTANSLKAGASSK